MEWLRLDGVSMAWPFSIFQLRKGLKSYMQTSPQSEPQLPSPELQALKVHLSIRPVHLCVPRSPQRQHVRSGHSLTCFSPIVLELAHVVRAGTSPSISSSRITSGPSLSLAVPPHEFPSTHS